MTAATKKDRHIYSDNLRMRAGFTRGGGNVWTVHQWNDAQRRWEWTGKAYRNRDQAKEYMRRASLGPNATEGY